jgi:hypothetical protein
VVGDGIRRLEPPQEQSLPLRRTWMQPGGQPEGAALATVPQYVSCAVFGLLYSTGHVSKLEGTKPALNLTKSLSAKILVPSSQRT